LAAKKFLASREGAAEGGFKGGIPPRPSVPPERSGGGQFRSKCVRAELYNSTDRNFVRIENGRPPRRRRGGEQMGASLRDELERGGHGKAGGFVLVSYPIIFSKL